MLAWRPFFLQQERLLGTPADLLPHVAGETHTGRAGPCDTRTGGGSRCCYLCLKPTTDVGLASLQYELHEKVLGLMATAVAEGPSGMLNSLLHPRGVLRGESPNPKLEAETNPDTTRGR